MIKILCIIYPLILFCSVIADDCSQLWISFYDSTDKPSKMNLMPVVKNGEMSQEWLNKNKNESIMAESGLSIFRISTKASVKNVTVQSTNNVITLSYKLSTAHPVHDGTDLIGTDLEVMYQNCNSPGKTEIVVTFSHGACPIQTFRWSAICSVVQTFTKIPSQITLSTNKNMSQGGDILFEGKMQPAYEGVRDPVIVTGDYFTYYVQCRNCLSPLLLLEPKLIIDDQIVHASIYSEEDDYHQAKHQHSSGTNQSADNTLDLYGSHAVTVKNRHWGLVGENERKVTLKFSCKEIGTSPIGVHLMLSNHHNVTFLFHKECKKVDGISAKAVGGAVLSGVFKMTFAIVVLLIGIGVLVSTDKGRFIIGLTYEFYEHVASKAFANVKGAINKRKEKQTMKNSSSSFGRKSGNLSMDEDLDYYDTPAFPVTADDLCRSNYDQL